MNQEFKINIWLGCYASYNDGYLLDKQYSCSSYEDVEKAMENFKVHVVETMKLERPDWYADGYIDEDTYAEELYIADYEAYLGDKFIQLKIGESIGELSDIFDAIEELDHLTDERVSLYVELSQEYSHEEAVQKVQDSLAVELSNTHSKEFDVGYYFAHDLFAIEIPEHIEPYFDYEGYGRDILLNSYTVEVGDYIFFID